MFHCCHPERSGFRAGREIDAVEGSLPSFQRSIAGAVARDPSTPHGLAFAKPYSAQDDKTYSNSAFAMGCGAVGPSPRSVSSIFLPFSAVETAVSIIISANRIVPWFSVSIALRIAW